MAMLKIPPVPTVGLRAERLFRNGSVTDGPTAAALANYLNALAGRRLKMVYSIMGPADLGFGTYAGDFGYGKFYTSANCGALMARVYLCPGAGTTNATFNFTLDAYANPTRYVAVRGGAAFGIDDFANLTVDESQIFIDSSMNPVAPSTEYTIKLTQGANANVIGYQLFEIPLYAFDTDDDLCMDPSQFAVGAPVTGQQLTDLIDKSYELCGHGTHHVYFSAPPNGPVDGAVNSSGASWTNIADASTTGWSSSACGFPWWSSGHGTLTTAYVPCTFWCVAKMGDVLAPAGSVRFTDDDGVMATITGVTGTTYAYYTTTANVLTLGTRKICMIEGQGSAGVGNHIKVAAAGFYEKR